MLDPMAYIEAQRVTRDYVEGALPDSPVRPDPIPVAQPVSVDRRLAEPRRRLSAMLRQIADSIEPAPDCPMPAAPCR